MHAEDAWASGDAGARAAAPPQGGHVFVGIDFGTTNSCVSLWHSDKDRAKVVKARTLHVAGEAGGAKDAGEAPLRRILPSSVVFGRALRSVRDVERVGVAFADLAAEAEAEAAAEAQGEKGTHASEGASLGGTHGVGAPGVLSRSVWSAKRVLGLRRGMWKQRSDCVLPFRLQDADLGSAAADDNGVGSSRSEEDGERIVLTSGGRELLVNPETVCSVILRHLKDSAEDYLRRKPVRRQTPVLGEPAKPPVVDRAVLSVPVHFTFEQRQALRRAAEAAGFVAVHFIAESTAAAMAYGLFVAGRKRALVFDMGGGTTDITLMTIDAGKFEVIGTAGSSALGGDDLDDALLTLVLQRIREKFPTSRAATAPLADAMRNTLRVACTAAKVRLSTETQTGVDVPDALLDPASRNGEPVVQVTREEFEACIAEHLDAVEALVHAAVEQARGITSLQQDVDEVVLIGGSSRVPAVRELLQRVIGADRELCTSVNPDEAVAQGAAIRAAILAGESQGKLRNLLMIDAVPMNIGVDTAEGQMHILLHKNDKLPAEHTEFFALQDEAQRRVTIKLYEGEGGAIEDNSLIASYDFPIGDEDASEQEQSDDQHEHVGRKVALSLRMTEHGVFHIAVNKHIPPGAVSFTQTFFLFATLLILFAAYVALKMNFAEELNKLSPEPYKVVDTDVTLNGATAAEAQAEVQAAPLWEEEL